MENEKEIEEPLNERRARFVYEAARLAAECANAPVVPAPWHQREFPFKRQFREGIGRWCGDAVEKSAEQMHAEWVDAYAEMGWRYGPVYDPEKKTHPDMVDYENLEPREREKDEVFIALCEIARKWIR